jgi:16S rRNA (guanine527-N7)-methyltransferase
VPPTPLSETPPDPDFPALETACRQLDIDLNEERYDLLLRYAQLLREWNRRINLVSRRDTGRVLSYHVVDSLAVQRLIPPVSRVCDVGTGAGLPGIPLAIVRPDLQVLLVEASQKRGQFLRVAKTALALANVEVMNERSESLAPLECDVVLSRLSGSLQDLVRQAGSHRKPSGTIILYKTRGCSVELAKAGRQLTRSRLRIAGSHDVLLPLSGIPRRFIVLGTSR